MKCCQWDECVIHVFLLKEDVQGLLKTFQLSTRQLHHMCGHSKVATEHTVSSLFISNSLTGHISECTDAKFTNL